MKGLNVSSFRLIDVASERLKGMMDNLSDLVIKQLCCWVIK